MYINIEVIKKVVKLRVTAKEFPVLYKIKQYM